MSKLFEKLASEINKANEADAILEKIWLEIGPYSNKISSEAMNRLRSYFEFDDSE